MHFKPLDQVQFHLFMSQVLHTLFASWSYTNFSLVLATRIALYKLFLSSTVVLAKLLIKKWGGMTPFFCFWYLIYAIIYLWHFACISFIDLCFFFPSWFTTLLFSRNSEKYLDICSSFITFFKFHKKKSLVFLLYCLKGKIWLQFVWTMPWCLDLLLDPSNGAVS
jgi:hypothetical protein